MGEQKRKEKKVGYRTVSSLVDKIVCLLLWKEFQLL